MDYLPNKGLLILGNVSPLEVNLPGGIKYHHSKELSSCFSGTEKGSIAPYNSMQTSLFDEAAFEILKLMELDTFPRFKLDKEGKEIWEKYLTEQAQEKMLTQRVKETSRIMGSEMILAPGTDE
jgi:hypothetical protein